MTNQRQTNAGASLARIAVNRFDALSVLGWAILGAVLCWNLTGRIDPRIISGQPKTCNAFDVWFEADSPRVFDNMTTRYTGTDDDRSIIHPFFSLLTMPAVRILQVTLRLRAPIAVRVYQAAVCAAWSALLYALLRCVGCGIVDACLLESIALVSAAGLFWFAVPETWPLSSLAVLFGLLVYVVQEHKPLSDRWHVGAQLACAGVTLTNAMVPLFGALTTLNRKRALRLALVSVTLFGLMFGVEKFLFRKETLGLPQYVDSYVFTRAAGGPAAVARAFFFHTVVMPQPQLIRREDPGWKFSIQASALGSGGKTAGVATLVWAVLLTLGLFEARRLSARSAFHVVLLCGLLGQFSLSLVYGNETFLYAINFLPFLLLTAAAAFRMRHRWVARALGVLLLCLMLPHNGRAFARTVQQFTSVLDKNSELETRHWLSHHPHASPAS